MKIWAHTIVHNEENFIWFSIMSVVDHVDKILVWDTGSDDNTVKIIEEIQKLKGDKIVFKEVGKVDKFEFTKMRQKMLDESNCDWILILDGDEIWWKESIRKVTQEIQRRGNEIDGIVVPMVVPVGDIYHLQEEEAGQYKILGRKGHLSLRAFSKKIPGLHVDWPYGRESFLDNENRPIQERGDIIFLDAPYLHVTHLKRSSKKRPFDKFKYEIGNKPMKNFRYPEVFYNTCPEYIPSPWTRISGANFLKAKLLTPLRKVKRRLIV